MKSDLERIEYFTECLRTDKSNITMIMYAIMVVAKAQEEIQNDLAWIKKKLKDEA